MQNNLLHDFADAETVEKPEVIEEAEGEGESDDGSKKSFKSNRTPIIRLRGPTESSEDLTW